ncbi:universal stress protein [Halomicrobium urmianum]|uniref:universal stress protein n=1 Tax=Halomicrobium urmianum TaxID=1586233 RepID=UPI001CD9BAE2|nr:universal stress protein [Halomicrobium urmianum]
MGSAQRVIEDDPAAGREYTLVVAVANPLNVQQLMRTAVDLARDRNGQIRVTSVVHKHVTSPFILFSDDRIKEEYADAQRAVLDEAVALAADASVPVKRSLLVGSDVSDAVLSAVEDADADALLLGWQYQSRASDVILGTTVDPVVRRAPCDVYVERIGTTADGVDDVLLPTDGGPHVAAAAELAGAVARANDAAVRVVSYVEPNAGAADREAAREHVREATTMVEDVPVDAGVCEAVAVAEAIVSAAADVDLVVLGATRERRLRRRVVGSVAQTVGQRAAPPIIIAKQRSETSLLRRALGRWT